MKTLPTVPFILALILLELGGLVGFLAALFKNQLLLSILFFITFALCRYRTNQLGRETERQYRDRFGPPK